MHECFSRWKPPSSRHIEACVVSTSVRVFFYVIGELLLGLFSEAKCKTEDLGRIKYLSLSQHTFFIIR